MSSHKENKQKDTIEQAFEARDTLSPTTADSDTLAAVDKVIDQLNQGHIRVAEQDDHGHWITHQWIKKAVLLYFRLHPNQMIAGQFTHYFDKVPLKYAHHGHSTI